jgi:hypothetical protein
MVAKIVVIPVGFTLFMFAKSLPKECLTVINKLAYSFIASVVAKVVNIPFDLTLPYLTLK